MFPPEMIHQVVVAGSKDEIQPVLEHLVQKYLGVEASVTEHAKQRLNDLADNYVNGDLEEEEYEEEKALVVAEIKVQLGAHLNLDSQAVAAFVDVLDLKGLEPAERLGKVQGLITSGLVDTLIKHGRQYAPAEMQR